MSQNIQEYLNNLINKPRMSYLDLNNQVQVQQNNHNCSTCHQQLQGRLYCESCNSKSKQLNGQITDLSEFTNLRGINASNNQFTNLDFLNTLPNKEKLKSLNLFGCQIKEVDFAELFTKFPNLEKISLQNNPLSAKNLNNLTSEQFGKLVAGIKEQKIKIHSFKGTILMDLLEYAQRLVSQGRPEAQAYLQTLNQMNQTTPPKTEKLSNFGWIIPVSVGSLLIGSIFTYFWLKKSKKLTKYE